jgi:hypothetical protein
MNARAATACSPDARATNVVNAISIAAAQEVHRPLPEIQMLVFLHLRGFVKHVLRLAVPGMLAVDLVTGRGLLPRAAAASGG